MDPSVLIGLGGLILSVLTYFAGVQRGEAVERRREAKAQARLVRQYVTFAGAKLPDLQTRLARLDRFEQAIERRHVYFETEVSLLSGADMDTLAVLSQGAASLDQRCSDSWQRAATAVRALHDEHERLRNLVSLASRIKVFDNLEGYRRRLLAAQQHLAEGVNMALQYADHDSREAIAGILHKGGANGPA